MSDAIDPGTLPEARLWHRLRHTPLRDLLRLRATGRLDIRAIVAPLPPPARELVLLVVKRTRLWRLEKAAVARELTAHFLDGLDAGASADQLVCDFGDPRVAARLIRRAKRRQRPIAWHALAYVTRAVAALLLIYACVGVYFLLGKPTVKVDYVAELNKPILATPESDRAWPLYRQAILQLQLLRPTGPGTSERDKALDRITNRVLDARPGSRHWNEVGPYLAEREAAIALIRQAAAKPELGFVLGPGGSQVDPALGWKPQPTDNDAALMSILLPDLNYLREFANLLSVDLRWAASNGQADRAVADFEALIGLAEQTRYPVIVNQLVAIGIDALAIDTLGRQLSEAPQTFDDAALRRLAHALARHGTGRPLISLETERMFFYDMVQRCYTDDGHGDGRLTPAGLRLLRMWQPYRPGDLSLPDDPVSLAARGPLVIASSRREVLAEYDAILDAAEAQLHRPAWEADWHAGESRRAEIKSSWPLTNRLLPVALLTPSLLQSGMSRERLLGDRDGLLVGIALELHRRQHGGYPDSLAALTPTLLPAVPPDRMTGRPVRYRLVDGKPLVYSVGADRDDDGGKLALNPRTGIPEPHRAIQWGVAADKAADGDWVLYPPPTGPGIDDDRYEEPPEPDAAAATHPSS
jgi:hypothetical protein